MFEAAKKTANGLAVEYIDGGVKYTLGDKEFVMVGEWQFGDIEINGKVIGQYDAGVNTLQITTFDGKHTVVLGDDEAAFEDFVLQVLQTTVA